MFQKLCTQFHELNSELTYLVYSVTPAGFTRTLCLLILPWKMYTMRSFSWKHVQRIYFLFPIIICATIDFLYAAYYTLFTQFFKDVMWAFTGSTIWQYLILEEIINLEIKIHQYLIKTMVYTFFLPRCSREWDVTCWKKLTGQLFHTQ